MRLAPVLRSVTTADEPHALAVGAHVEAAHVGLRTEAVGHDPAVEQTRQDPLHLRMIDAQRGNAVERDVGGEGDECLAQRLERPVVVEVLGIDVGDDRDRRRQLDHRAVELVGLGDHPVAANHAGRWSPRR